MEGIEKLVEVLLVQYGMKLLLVVGLLQVVGGDGTSYGGGLRGGSFSNYQGWTNQKAENAALYGGKYNAVCVCTTNGFESYVGRLESGGMLLVYAMIFEGQGKFTADGSFSHYYDQRVGQYIQGGATGGGSLNIFAKEEINFEENSLSASGGASNETATYGGKGSATAGIISTGVFVIKYSK